jgi:hypothetical protein
VASIGLLHFPDPNFLSRPQWEIAMTKSFKVFLFAFGALLCVGWGMGACTDRTDAGGDSKGGKSAPPPKELNLAYGFDEGWLLNHDFFLTNTSGENLTEVHLRITFVGEDGSPSVDRYWAAWSLGQKEQVSIPVDKVKNVQRIQVAGRADQGVIDVSLTPRK